MSSSKARFESLAREHAEMLMVYLRAALRDTNAAEDVFQETMLTAWRIWDRFDEDRPFGPWLRGIASKLVLAHFRRAKRRDRPCDVETLQLLEDRLSQLETEAQAEQQDLVKLLTECIQDLPDHYREAVKLRYGPTLSTEKIAEALDISPAGVTKRLQRARVRLQACIERKVARKENPV